MTALVDNTGVDPSAGLPRRRRKPWTQWVVTAAITAAVVAIGWQIAASPAVSWSVFARYLTNEAIIDGLWMTLALTVISQCIATLLGFALALMQRSANRGFRWIAGTYVWIFRGIPLLVQLLFWYNLALIFPVLSIGIPGTSLQWSENTNLLISGFTASILGLALNEAAYMAEIVRGSILAIPSGQSEAALSLGMKRTTALRRVVMPQALRSMIPPTGNQFIGLLKASSLVAVIGGGDLLTRAQHIYSQNYQVIPVLLVACFWYLVLATLCTTGQFFLERSVDPSRAKPSTRDVLRSFWRIRPQRAGES